ncbi:hypothetical protein Tco_0478606 [Tanacetum coccineum]
MVEYRDVGGVVVRVLASRSVHSVLSGDRACDVGVSKLNTLSVQKRRRRHRAIGLQVEKYVTLDRFVRDAAQVAFSGHRRSATILETSISASDAAVDEELDDQVMEPLPLTRDRFPLPSNLTTPDALINGVSRLATHTTM